MKHDQVDSPAASLTPAAEAPSADELGVADLRARELNLDGARQSQPQFQGDPFGDAPDC